MDGYACGGKQASVIYSLFSALILQEAKCRIRSGQGKKHRPHWQQPHSRGTRAALFAKGRWKIAGLVAAVV